MTVKRYLSFTPATSVLAFLKRVGQMNTWNNDEEQEGLHEREEESSKSRGLVE